jgi:taurine dioxygenase
VQVVDFETVPLSDDIGVEIQNAGFDQIRSDDVLRLFVREELARHRVVLFRNQRDIRANELSAFMSTFGPLLNIRAQNNNAHHVADDDIVKVISNMTAPDGRPLGDGNSSAQVWHSDGTVWEVPTATNAMYCRVAPTPAPKTSFLDMIKVYADLPAELKDRIRELRVIHHVYDRQLEVNIDRYGESLSHERRRQGTVHPLVRRHMATGAPILYLPTRRDSVLVGWSDQESRALLDELKGYVEQSTRSCSVGLVPDDLVIWDNTATLHSREGWPPRAGRAVWHVASEGEIPTPLYGQRNKNPYSSHLTPA